MQIPATVVFQLLIPYRSFVGNFEAVDPAEWSIARSLHF